MNELKIFIDKREPPSIKTQIREEGIPYEFKKLEVGDYIIPLSDEEGDAYAFERKAWPTDFNKSFYSGRTVRQLKNLVRYTHPCLIIEGEVPYGLTPVSWYELKTLYVRLIGLWVGFDVPFLTTATPKATAAWIILTWKKIDKKKHGVNKPKLLRRIPVGTNPEQVRRLMLTAMKGIGASTADALIGKYKTPIAIANEEVSQLAKVQIGQRKLGEIKAKYIKEILTGVIDE